MKYCYSLYILTLFLVTHVKSADTKTKETSDIAVAQKSSDTILQADNNQTTASDEKRFNELSEQVFKSKLAKILLTRITKNGVLAATFGAVCIYLLDTEFNMLTKPTCVIPVLSVFAYSAHKHVYHLCNKPLNVTQEIDKNSSGLTALELLTVGSLGILSGFLYKDRIFFDSPIKLCMTLSLASLTSNFAGIHYRYFPLYSLALLTASNPERSVTLAKQTFNKIVTTYQAKHLTRPI